MPLADQPVPFVFDAGLDQTVDPTVDPSSMLEVTNGVFRQRGRVEKRPGLSNALDRGTYSGAEGLPRQGIRSMVQAGAGVATIGHNGVKVYDPNGQRLQPNLFQTVADFEAIDTYRLPGQVIATDACMVNGFIVQIVLYARADAPLTATQDGNRVLIARVLDPDSLQEVVSPLLVAESTLYPVLTDYVDQPRVEVLNNEALIFWLYGDVDVRVRPLSLAVPSAPALGATLTVAAAVFRFSDISGPARPVYDTTTDYTTKVFVALVDDATKELRLYGRGAAGVAAGQFNTGVTDAAFQTLCCYANGTTDVVLLWQKNSGVAPDIATVNKTLLAFVSGPVATALPAVSAFRSLMIARTTAGTTPELLLSADYIAEAIHFATCTYVLGSQTAQNSLWGTIIGKPHYYTTQDAVAGETFVYPVYFIQKPTGYAAEAGRDGDFELDAQPDILAVVNLRGTASAATNVYGAVAFGRVNVNSASAKHYLWPRQTVAIEATDAYGSTWLAPLRVRGPSAGALGASPDLIQFQNDAQLMRIDYRLKWPCRSVRLGGNAYVAGGLVHEYGARGMAESAISWRPILRLADLVAAAGGNLSAGTYQYILVYEWVSPGGGIVRSQPSAPASVTALANDKVTLNLRLPLYQTSQRLLAGGEGVPSRIVIYRTAAGGTNFLRLLSLTPTTDVAAAGVAWPSISVVDTFADAFLGADILYTQLELANDPPPPAWDVASWGSRLCVINALNRGQLWISKTLATDAAGNQRGVEFSATLTVLLPPGNGGAEAIAGIDEKLVIFKRSSIYVLTGVGPDANGQGGGFGEPREISSDVGCINRFSVVVSELGVFFEGDAGIYLLDRSMQVQFVGAAVQDVVPGLSALPQSAVGRIVSAVALQRWHEVRFAVADSNQVLVHNYLYQRWSRFGVQSTAGVQAETTDRVRDLAELGGNMLVLKDTASVSITNIHAEDPAGAYQDRGINYPLQLSTPWFKFAGISGYQRTKNLLFTAEYRTAMDLLVELFYDYETSAGNTFTFATAAIPPSTKPQTVKIKIPRQKTQALKVRYTDRAAGLATPALQAFRAIEQQLIAGVKDGGAKLPSARRA